MEHQERIRNNLVYLTEKLSNIDAILSHLQQKGIISQNERDEILLLTKTPHQKNAHLLAILTKKDWKNVLDCFISILRVTGNRNCADIVEGVSTVPQDYDTVHLLESKWWPEEKLLVNSFFERKTDDGLLVEELNKCLLKNVNGTTVISQKVTVSGLGGIGKTTTAIWYARHYHQSYDYIIWIDCGEGSLSQSFKLLASDLKVENRNEFDIKGLARKCFALLSLYKCLVIFDNAECYIGHDGIRDVLPKNHINVHCIITSRSTEWGNKSGFGKITCFPLDVFDIQDSICFLKNNLNSLEYTEDQLNELCESLGNLPLALQIAVATINSRQMAVHDYTKRVKVTDQIINTNFDDYEKTINNTMRISLDLIEQQPNSKLLLDIVHTFGYIQPDDVPLEFIRTVEGRGRHIFELEESVCLLEKFSLISVKRVKRGYYDTEKESGVKMFVSIHRLLQQVIRHNCLTTEKQTICKILELEDRDYTIYKLTPFKYAEKYPELKSRFAYVKGQLMDHINIQSILKEGRFTDAIQLSQMLVENYPTGNRSLVTQCNYAICLQLSGDEKKAYDVFNSVLHKLEIEEYDLNPREINLNLISMQKVPNISTVKLWLLHLQLHLDPCSKQLVTQKHLKHIGSLKTISITGMLLPIHLDAFTNIRILELERVQIISKTHDRPPSLPYHRNQNDSLEKLVFYLVTFVEDMDGKLVPCERINLNDLKLDTRELQITDGGSKNSPSVVNVDLANLPPSVVILGLHSVQLKCTDKNLPEEIKIKFFAETTLCYISFDLNPFVSRCRHLVGLELRMKFILNLSILPHTLKHLKMYNVNVISDEGSSPLALDKLCLLHYPFDQLQTVIKNFTYDFTIIQFMSDNLEEYKTEIWQIIDLSKKIVIGTNFKAHKFNLQKMGFSKYGILEDSFAYFIRHGRGHDISIVDFVNHTHFNTDLL